MARHNIYGHWLPLKSQHSTNMSIFRVAAIPHLRNLPGNTLFHDLARFMLTTLGTGVGAR